MRPKGRGRQGRSPCRWRVSGQQKSERVGGTGYFIMDKLDGQTKAPKQRSKFCLHFNTRMPSTHAFFHATLTQWLTDKKNQQQHHRQSVRNLSMIHSTVIIKRQEIQRHASIRKSINLFNIDKPNDDQFFFPFFSTQSAHPASNNKRSPASPVQVANSPVILLPSSRSCSSHLVVFGSPSLLLLLFSLFISFWSTRCSLWNGSSATAIHRVVAW